MFFESLADCSLCFTYISVAAVDVTRDVIYWCSLGVLSLGCTTIERKVLAGLWCMCMLCDLYIRPSCSDNPATYGSPNTRDTST